MPELPEVERTVRGLKKTVVGKTIKTCWSNYASDKYTNKNEIKNQKFFACFQKKIKNTTILSVFRRGKNIIINLDNQQTIHIHLKMTGHLLFGTYQFSSKNNTWTATDSGPLLNDPYNQHIHFVITFSDGTHLVMSDMRKFAKITLFDTLSTEEHLKNLGPEPFDKSLTPKIFREVLLRRPNKHIKTALMDQGLIVGIGNIYSDEALFLSKIHPETKVKGVDPKKFGSLLKHVREVMVDGVDLIDLSRSDFRNIDGTTATFTAKNNVYRRTGSACSRRCSGTIERKMINGRAAHFCPICQEPPKA